MKAKSAPGAAKSGDIDDPDFPELIGDEQAESAAPQKGTPGPKPMFTEAEVIEALRGAGGFTSVAAMNLKCSVDTIERAVKRWPRVARARAECRAAEIDKAEGALQKAIGEGNITGIIFFLKCRAKDRGYVERTELTGADGASLVESVVPLTSLSLALRRQIAAELDAAEKAPK